MLLSNGALAQTTYGDLESSWVGQEYYGGSGLALSNAFASYAAVYRSQVWVSALVNKIARSAARLPLKVYERAGDGARNEARDSDFAKLLRNPNPRDDPFFFWLWTVSTFELYGEAMWVKVRPRRGAAPIQLWPMHPANITTKRDDRGNLIYKHVQSLPTGKSLEWSADDVVHFKSYSAENQARGMSCLEPLRQTILNENAAGRAAQAMWSNGGRPSMAFTSPNKLSDAAHARLTATVQGMHQGVDNWGKIAVLEEGLSPTLFPLNAEAMQFIESRKVSREEACGVFDVPPPVVQILDHATFSNITEQMRSMYRDTMAPRLGLYESALDAQLRPDFDPQGKLYAEFLLDEVLRGAFEQRAAANQAAIFSGQRTPNEVRRQDNLPPLDGGDVLYINQGAAPLLTAGQDAADAPQDAAPDVVKGLVVPEDACGMCGTETKTSARGLCRSCEGKVGVLLQRTAARRELG